MCKSLRLLFYNEACITCNYLFKIDKLQLYFLQMAFADCICNRFNSHIICCGIFLLWRFEMLSTAPKRFEYHKHVYVILNIWNVFDTTCKLKKTKRSTKMNKTQVPLKFKVDCKVVKKKIKFYFSTPFLTIHYLTF